MPSLKTPVVRKRIAMVAGLILLAALTATVLWKSGKKDKETAIDKSIPLDSLNEV